MPVEKVWVHVEHGEFSGLVGEGGPVQIVPIREDGVWKVGPLYLRTHDLSDEPMPGSREEYESLVARLAANDLIAVLDEHEEEDHDGEPCHGSRIGMVAFLAHSLGLMPVHMAAVAEELAIYEHEHVHRHGERSE